MRKSAVLPLAATLLGVLPGTAFGQTTIRYAHMNSPTHFVNAGGEQLAAALAQRTNGAIKVELFPSAQLGENSQITEQISLGGDLISQVGIGTVADYVPDLSIIVYPFIYPSFEAAQRFLKSDLIKELEARAEAAANVKILCYIHYGVRDLYTREKEVHGPADTEGMSIRVQPVPIYTEMVEKVFGGAPTPMPWPDVYSALAQGVIDAAEAPPVSILDQKHQEHAKFLIQTNHIMDISPIVTSASLFNSLSEENQQIFQEEADRACDSMSQASIASYEKGIEDLRSAGMTIVGDVDRDAFAERAGAIAAAFPEWSEGLYERARAIITAQ
ncbi:TRAP transporter substrate-binding protein DctP [Devosia sp.]|uniref:TRAP transporter substrate-binding protein DctP n=1 Tax=Devosia sp. TaxID=1871048 RepID=UPI002F22E2AC